MQNMGRVCNMKLVITFSAKEKRKESLRNEIEITVFSLKLQNLFESFGCTIWKELVLREYMWA